jgi:hypothetical protein
MGSCARVIRAGGGKVRGQGWVRNPWMELMFVLCIQSISYLLDIGWFIKRIMEVYQLDYSLN